MATDPTENVRRGMLAEAAAAGPKTREELEAKYGQVWTTAEMSADFTAMGFLAPVLVVTRKSDGAVGSLEFQHDPRFYFKFVLD